MYVAALLIDLAYLYNRPIRLWLSFLSAASIGVCFEILRVVDPGEKLSTYSCKISECLFVISFIHSFRPFI